MLPHTIMHRHLSDLLPEHVAQRDSHCRTSKGSALVCSYEWVLDTAIWSLGSMHSDRASEWAIETAGHVCFQIAC